MQTLNINEIVEELTKFGITKNQALVYLALVSTGKASVRKISQVSNVRREEVYRIIPKLEKLGLIEKILGRPAKFRAVPPESALSILINKQEEEFNKKIKELAEKREKLTLILNNLAANNLPALESTSVSEFVLMYDIRCVLQKAIEMLRKAEKEILAIITEETIFYLVNSGLMEEIMKILKAKKIKFKIIIHLGKFKESIYDLLKKESCNLNRNIKVRLTEKIVLSLFILDDKEAIISVPERSGRGVHPDLWTDSPEYVKRLRLLFEDYWLNSIDAQFWMESFKRKTQQKRVEVIKWGRLKYYIPTFKERIRKAKKEILFLLNYEGALVAREIGLCEALREGIKKGKINVRGIVQVKDKNKLLPIISRLLPEVNVRFFGIISPMLLTIIDRKELIMCTYFRGDKMLIWSNTEYMVEPFRSYFKEIWKKASSTKTTVI